MIKLFLAFIVLSIFVHFQLVNAWDLATTHFLQNTIPRFLDAPLSIFSLLGSAEITCGLWLIIAAILVYKRQWKILTWFCLFWAGLGIEIIGKHWLYQPGPAKELYRSIIPFLPSSQYVHTNYSYPSGHVYRTAFLVVVALSIISHKNVRYLLLIFLLLMIISRVYLGEHWLSDTLGGVTLGIGMALVASYGVRRRVKQENNRNLLE